MKKRSIIFASAIGLGLTVFVAQIWAFWEIENNLPDYAKVAGNLPQLYLGAIEPTIIVLIVFIIFSLLNLKNARNV